MTPMTITLAQIIPQAGNATTFVFKPSMPTTWKAGNSFHLEIAGDYAPVEHTFTISSAPHERHIAITTRRSDSPFKRSLFAMRPGDQAEASAIGGTFTWRDTSLRPVFLASGIGITPFRAMLKQRVLTGQKLPITLLYGSATDDIIFKTELDEWNTDHPEFTVHHIIGERLRLSHIREYADAKKSLFYLSGPSAMVDDISAALLDDNVLEPQLVRDWFTGHLPDADVYARAL
jgi:ferredoxin-NADP reductase